MRIKKIVSLSVMLVLFLTLSTTVMADNTSKNRETDVNIGFDKDTTVASSNEPKPDVPKQPDEVVIPKYPSKNLPQLSSFIEPMTFILLGLLIWLAVLSVVALNRYLRKEGEC